MDMINNEAVLKGFHFIAEGVPADNLRDILYELRTVEFDVLPFLCGSYTFVDDGFAIVLVLLIRGFTIG
jgi:hypothetical protein